jgi:multimeric flavodoxin WrbA
VTQRFNQWKKFQTKRLALSETGESGNGGKRRRSATGQKIFNGSAENGKFYGRSDFNPRCRNGNGNLRRPVFNFTVRDGDDGTIVIVFWNRPAMQPGMKRRPRFGHRHEQPDRQRQHPRRQMEALAVSAADETPSVLQNVCNIAKTLPPASGFSPLTVLAAWLSFVWASMTPTAILGSAREDSNTAVILRRLIAERVCEIVDLRTCPVSPFSYKHSYPVGDQFVSIIRRVVCAPVTIIATPVYWYSYSTPMKIFIDRFSDLLTFQKELGRQLRGRHFALLSSSSEPWPDKTLVEAFSRFCDYLGITFVGCVHAQDAGEFVDLDAVAKIRGYMKTPEPN